MSFDFANAKKIARRAVHSVFGVRAFYYTDDSANAIETRARWHNKHIVNVGDLAGDGYSQIIEGIDRIVFLREDYEDGSFVLDSKGQPLTLERGGLVEFPDSLPNAQFVLDHKEPDDGPIEETWNVTRRNLGSQP